ncbi:hypothetical protein GV792_07805 [Nocardia cyriacigeorgica]|uniref:hypothetical protein n=1 Tax=Nocardia cyriacigeorgica TaxID=135487 RepID=UPI0013BCE030|nr:hypothetical protein [Nocardia cyriacigeorgica]NEW49957.1 hypothetical protein [Nocardia cyriacigeorgica]
MPISPSERALYGRLGAHESWSHTEDRAARTAPAREGFMDRFDRQVDPDRKLTEAERARRAEHARKAYFTRLALKSVQARRKAAEARAAFGGEAA